MTLRTCSSILMTLLVACARSPEPASGSCGGFLCEVGERCDAASLHCVADAPPTLSLAGPDAVVTAERFTLTGTVTDDGAPSRLEWRVGEAGDWHRVLPDGDGHFSLDVETPRLDAALVEVTVRATDAVVSVERSVSVRVDRVGPTLEVLSPAAETVVAGRQLAVKVRVGDGSGVLSSVALLGQRQALSTPGEVTLQVELPEEDLRTLDLLVEATDGAGNSTRVPWRLQHDGAGPQGRFIGLAPDMPALGGGRVSVAFEPQDRSGVAGVQFSLGGVTAVGVPTQDGSYVASLALPASGTGRVELRADLRDRVGNASRVTLALPYDADPPEVTLAAPQAGTVVGQAFPVRVTSSDAALVTAQLGAVSVSLQRGADGAWWGTMPLGLSGDFIPAALVIEARDVSGNLRRLPDVELRIDTVAPRLVFLTPSAGALLGQAAIPSDGVVPVHWRVEDGNPAALTTAVQGAASSATTYGEPTTSTEDGVAHVVSVTVSDGVNERTVTHGFRVDRVAPRVVTWSPDAERRNVDPEARVTFSEPVFAPAGGPDVAAVVTPAEGTGGWDPSHAAWTVRGLAGGRVFSMALASLVDLAGNALVAPPPRRFHVAVVTPPSGLEVATDAQEFKAVSSNDGAVLVGIRRGTDFVIKRLDPATGTVSQLDRWPGAPAQFDLTGTSRIDPGSLEERVSFAVSSEVNGVVTRMLWTDGVPTALSSVSGTGAVVTGPAQLGERSTDPYGTIAGTTYARGGWTTTLSLAPTTIAQGPADWVGSTVARGLVSWVRYTCSGPVGAATCYQVVFDASATTVTNLRGVMHPAGSCFVSSWDAAGAHQVLFQPLVSCPVPLGVNPPPSCRNTSGLRPSTRTDGLRVAPFALGTQRTLLGAFWDGGLVVGRLRDASACEPRFDAVGPPLSDVALQFEPIQVGNRPALLYIDAAHTLKLYVP